MQFVANVTTVYDFNPRVVNPSVEEFNRDSMKTFLRIIKLKTKVYISNLSKKTNETDLKYLFSQAGKVTWVAIVRGRYSKQSRGTALIEMETEDGIRGVIKRFNGGRLHGNIIVVSKNNKDFTLSY